MSVSTLSKLLRMEHYAAVVGLKKTKKKNKKLQSTSSSLDHPSKSPWRSGSMQARWGILRGQGIKKNLKIRKKGKEKRSVRGMRQRGEEMKPTREGERRGRTGI